MHVLDVTRDPDVGGGQGLVVLDVGSDADLTGCPDCGVIAVGHGRHVQVPHDAPCFGTPVRGRWRKRIWRPSRISSADKAVTVMEAPFGGFKKSGVGRDVGSYALHAYSEVQAIVAGLTRGRRDYGILTR